MGAARLATTPRPIAILVDAEAAPPASRVVLEEGAYLFVDFLYPDPPQTDRWPRLTVGRALVFDLTPSREPILLELRQVVESWQESANLSPPEATIAGTARILATGRRATVVTVRTNPERSTVHIRLATPGASVAVRVAAQVLFEVADLMREGPDTLRGRMVGIWVLDLPKLSVGMVLLRALGVTGPPIGIGTPGESQEAERTTSPARPSTPEPERLH